MVEFSSLVSVSSNGPDPLDGVSLVGMVAGDELTSGILPIDTRNATSAVLYTSSTWNTGGVPDIPSDTSGKWEEAADYVNAASGPIGALSSWQNSASGPIGAVSSWQNAASGPLGAVSSWQNAASGNIASMSGSIGAVSAWQNSASGPIGALSAWQNAASGNLAIISGNQETSADPYWNQSWERVDASAGPVWNSLHTSCAASAFFGTSPTVLEDTDVDFNNNKLLNVGKIVRMDPGGKILQLSAQGAIYLIANQNGLTDNTSFRVGVSGAADGGVRDVDYHDMKQIVVSAMAISGSYENLVEHSGTYLARGGAGPIDAFSGIMSGTAVGPLSSVDLSGMDGAALDTPGDGYSLMLDTAAERVKWVQSPFIIKDGVIVQAVDGFGTGPSLNLDLGDDVDLSFSGGLQVSGGVSSVDGAGSRHYMSMERDPDATYKNLLRATEGTITIQPEDDVHIKTNSGEDCARFNENAAVWLYYNNEKKIETTADGAHVSGILRVSTSSIQVSGPAGMQMPGAYSQVKSTDEAGANDTEFYFPSGHATAVTESDIREIEFFSPESYFMVSSNGWYEADCCVGVTADSVNLTLIQIVITTGYGGTEALQARQVQTIHTLTDPHQLRVHGIFYVEAGEFVAFKFTSSSGNIVSNVTGNSAWIKRIG